MATSRRDFLRTGGIGLAAATLPLPSFAYQRCGEPPRAPQPGGPILLNGNENPYGPLPSVKAVMQEALGVANRYPDFRYEQLVGTISKLHQVKAEQVHVACGSTEILKMAADEFSAGSRLVVPNPTFEAIIRYAEAEHGNVVKVPLRNDFAHDLPGMLKAMGAGPGLFYICNPNNPTASLTPRAEIEDFLKRLPPNTYVLIDEAYHHFAMGAPGYESFIDKPVDDERVIVARTFSKVYGMAGLRLGYAIGAGDTMKRFKSESLDDDVNCIAAPCGVAALQHPEEMKATAERIKRDRTAFLDQCDARRIRYVPTYANFAMIYCGNVSREVRASMHAQGIRIGRPFPPMDKWCRISFGTPEEMAQFWKTWDGLKDCLGEIRET